MFADLPLDLVLSILQHATISDIISVGATCRSLHTAATERCLWWQIVSELCEAYGVSDGTYDLCSMTRQELQALAFRSPHFIDRFTAAAAARNNQSTLSPRITCTIRQTTMGRFFPSAYALRPWKGFCNCCLLPGGRFLVTSYRHSLISIWDLNQALAGFETTLEPVTSLFLADIHDENLDEWTYDLEAACTASDNKTLRVIVHAYVETGPGDYEDSTIRVYELNLTDSNPSFRFVSSRKYFARVTAFDGDLLAMAAWKLPRERDSIVIWDLNCDVSIGWDLPDPSTSVSRLAVSTKYLLTIENWDAVDLRIYPIPPRSPYEPGSHNMIDVGSIPSKLLPDITACEGSQGLSGPSAFRIMQPSCKSQAFQPVMLLGRHRLQSPEALNDGQAGITQTRGYVLHPPDGELNNLQVLPLPNLIITNSGNIHQWRVPSSYCIRSRGMEAYISVWTENPSDESIDVPVKMSISRKDSDIDTDGLDRFPSQEEDVQLLGLENFPVDWIQFCPMSARVVVWKYRGDVRILQY